VNKMMIQDVDVNGKRVLMRVDFNVLHSVEPMGFMIAESYSFLLVLIRDWINQP